MRWNVIFIADRQFFESCSSSDDAVVWYYLKRKVILNCHRPMYSFSVFVLSFLLWTIKTTHNIYISILNGIVMEKTTPLNGPTTTGQSWKETKAKGFGLLIMFTTLLLGLAFHAGQMSGGTVAGSTRVAVTASMMSHPSAPTNWRAALCTCAQTYCPDDLVPCARKNTQCDFSSCLKAGPAGLRTCLTTGATKGTGPDDWEYEYWINQCVSGEKCVWPQVVICSI